MANKLQKFTKYLIPLAAFFTFSAFYLFPNSNSSDLPIIAITQIIDHHTLDEVRTGMIDALQQQGFKDGETVHIVYENANGNVSVATEIAKKFQTLKPAVIVALSTQSAQTLISIARQEHVPLVFTAVTDPVAAKLVTAYDKTAEGVTGISDYMPADPQLKMIQEFVPPLKKLGILYNPSEVNSVSILKQMEQAANASGIELVYAAANNTAEVVAATKSLLGKVDAIYFPNDNTVMAAASAVANIANQEKIPVFANDSASVASGVLAAVAYDRKAMGGKTADIVAGLLRGRMTADFPVTHDVPQEVVVNSTTQALLSIAIPENYRNQIRLLS
ncbi:ABC transporter substrate-binding protein [Candidatus Paracaedibacter symbiosus]|uniref:ABC transporter substrate-binding protein n=1 Tax=Candidatus Paracaedibacter symbiosus TaxID=244582 RepID=UPI000689E16F|nr:ABC transporter substrate-binding protein [Candidatus Paracaedibacter symbiosus]